MDRGKFSLEHQILLKAGRDAYQAWRSTPKAGFNAHVVKLKDILDKAAKFGKLLPHEARSLQEVLNILDNEGERKTNDNYTIRVQAMEQFTQIHGESYRRFLKELEAFFNDMKEQIKSNTTYVPSARKLKPGQITRQLTEADKARKSRELKPHHLTMKAPFDAAEHFAEHLKESGADTAEKYRQNLDRLKARAAELFGHYEKMHTGQD